MRTRTLSIFAVIAAITLAGCAGGGAGTPFNNPSSPGSGSQMTAQEAAQTGASTALSEIENHNLDSSLFSGSVGTVLSSSRMPMSIGSKTTGTCNNGVIKTVTVVSPTETIYDVQSFYDAGCTQLRRDSSSDVQQPNASTENIVRTIKNYNAAGLLMSTRTTNYSVTGAPGNFSAVVTSALLIGTSSTPEEQGGHQLTVAPQSANVSTIAGNGARIENVAVPSINESFGSDSVLQNVTATTDVSGDVTFAGTRNRTYFKGALGSLSIPASPPFSISGGTNLGTGTLTGSVQFDANDQLLSVALNGTFVNGNTVVVTSSGSGSSISINGVISSPSGTQLATFSVDRFGNGLITYANGAQAVILDWHVVK